MTQLIISAQPAVSFLDTESNASFWHDYQAYMLQQSRRRRQAAIRRVIHGAIERADYYRLTYESAERSTHTDEEIEQWIIGGNHAS